MFTKKNSLKMSAGAVALMVGLTAPMAATADEVSLRSTDGTINVNGELIEVRDGSYIIRTALGELNIAVSRVVCEGDACPSFEEVSADVAIVGSEAMGLRLMPLLMAGYATSLDAEADITNTSREEGIATLIGDGGFGDEIGSFSFAATGDDSGFNALLTQDAQIGMSSRRIVVDEARALRADGSESMVGQDQERIVAVDSVLVITHADNPVQTLTTEQLRGIFSGEILNWAEVGGDDKEINLVNYETDSSNYEFFMSYLYGEDIPEALPDAVAADDQVAANVVFQDQYSIGYVGYAFQRGTRPITVVSECGISMLPDAFAAKTEEYELSRRMYMYNRGDTLGDQAREFLSYVASEDADGVILKSGYIDLGIERRAQESDDARRVAMQQVLDTGQSGFEGTLMQEAVDLMDGNDRLSTTIRFRAGSSRIDERGQTDMERLVRYLEGEPSGTTVTFVGFTDDVGAFEANRTLSSDRAAQIASEVEALSAETGLSGISFASAGFGEIAPNACNSTEQGRSINRRVEVWINNG